MDELCDSFVELDMESKYFETVPYDSDDPDFEWYKNVSNSEDEVSGHQPNSSSNDQDESTDSQCNKRKRQRRKKPEGRETILDETTNLESSTSIHNEKMKISRWEQTPSWADRFGTSDSDTEGSCKEILRRHRKLTSSYNSNVKEDDLDFKVKYPTNIYPRKEETVRSVSSTAYTETMPSHPCAYSYSSAVSSFMPSHPSAYTYSSAVSSLDTGYTKNFVVTTSETSTPPRLDNRIIEKYSIPTYGSTTLPKFPVVDPNYLMSTYVSPAVKPEASSCKRNYANFINTYPSKSVSPAVPKLNRRDSQTFTKRTSGSSCNSSASEGEPCNYDAFKIPYKKFRKSSKAIRRAVNPNEIIPCYRDHQLLGDSQLLRFSEQLLDCKPFVTHSEDTSSRRLGYCVSGQKIKELEQRIIKQELKLSDKLIILIGTNDMIYGTELKSMCDSFNLILSTLKKNAEKIVVLTVPPVPKLADDNKHMTKLRQFNKFLMSLAEEQKVFLVDLASLYISYSNTVSVNFFEQYFYKNASSSKIDLIHLNRDGFKLLKAILDIEYFDKFYSKHA